MFVLIRWNESFAHRAMYTMVFSAVSPALEVVGWCLITIRAFQYFLARPAHLKQYHFTAQLQNVLYAHRALFNQYIMGLLFATIHIRLMWTLGCLQCIR